MGRYMYVLVSPGATLQRKEGRGEGALTTSDRQDFDFPRRTAPGFPSRRDPHEGHVPGVQVRGKGWVASFLLRVATAALTVMILTGFRANLA